MTGPTGAPDGARGAATAAPSAAPQAAAAPASTPSRWLRHLLALSTVLGFVAGFVDTATFIEMQGLFVAHVTGNFVLLGAALAGAEVGGSHDRATVLQLASFPIFIAGAIVAAALAGTLADRWRTPVILALVAVLIGVAGAATFGGVGSGLLAMVLVLAMGLLNAAHRMDARLGAPFTVMTGNVTAVAIGLAHLLRLAPRRADGPVKPAPAPLVVVVVAFAAGCALGAALQPFLGLGAMVVPAALLAIRLLVRRGGLPG